jgi:RimJ/RimL family protein N-acetyltransferase
MSDVDLPEPALERRGVLGRGNAGATRRMTLRDRCVVDVRPLDAGDSERVAAAMSRLSAESWYLRFGSAKPRLPGRELGFLLDVDHHDNEALTAIDPSTGQVVAVGRYVQVPEEPGVAEIAVTVADDWQSRGLGGAMLMELTERARDEGHTMLHASVLGINRRSIAMLLRAGFARLEGAGVLREYQLPLEVPQPTKSRADRDGRVVQEEARDFPIAPGLIDDVHVTRVRP